MTRGNITKLALSIVFLCFVLSTFVSLWSLHTMAKRNMEDLGKSLAAQIYDTISSELSEPIIVSRTMASDMFLISILENEGENTTDETTTLMSRYLTGLSNSLDYESAFVISDASKSYYSCSGLGKKMDLENDYHDQWYPQFIQTGQPYAVDVDRDELNADAWTVFINARVENEQGRLLGVCGVGMHMKKSQALFQELEKAYKLKIDLVDETGLIKVDINENLIEQEYIQDVPLQKSDAYVYENRGLDHYIVTRYLDRLGWYMVVQNNESGEIPPFVHLLLLNVISCVIVMIIIFISTRIIVARTEALTHASLRDQATSLLNRRAFEEEKVRLAEMTLPDDFIYMTADLNGLKTVNDTLGHAAGDELIKGAAECLKSCLGSYGSVYRIGGDEFAALLTITEDDLNRVIARIQETSDSWSENRPMQLSLSLGWAAHRELPSENISEIMRISDERMYAAKELYYQNNKAARRRR